jgi:hypothetical protein
MSATPAANKAGGARAVPRELKDLKDLKPASATPSREEIARRAYEIYVARGRAVGHETEDWVQAERELLARTNGRN